MTQLPAPRSTRLDTVPMRMKAKWSRRHPLPDARWLVFIAIGNCPLVQYVVSSAWNCLGIRRKLGDQVRLVKMEIGLIVPDFERIVKSFPRGAGAIGSPRQITKFGSAPARKISWDVDG